MFCIFVFAWEVVINSVSVKTTSRGIPITVTTTAWPWKPSGVNLNGVLTDWVCCSGGRHTNRLAVKGRHYVKRGISATGR